MFLRLPHAGRRPLWRVEVLYVLSDSAVSGTLLPPLSIASGRAGLDAGLMDSQIETPLKRLLDEQNGTRNNSWVRLVCRQDSNKRMQGICDITLHVMPTGPAETFVLKIDVPEFKKGNEQQAG